MTSKHKMAKNTRAQGGYRLVKDKVMTANSLGRLQASTRRSFGGVPLIVLQPWGGWGGYKNGTKYPREWWGQYLGSSAILDIHKASIANKTASFCLSILIDLQRIRVLWQLLLTKIRNTLKILPLINKIFRRFRIYNISNIFRKFSICEILRLLPPKAPRPTHNGKQ